MEERRDLLDRPLHVNSAAIKARPTLFRDPGAKRSLFYSRCLLSLLALYARPLF